MKQNGPSIENFALLAFIPAASEAIHPEIRECTAAALPFQIVQHLCVFCCPVQFLPWQLLLHCPPQGKIGPLTQSTRFSRALLRRPRQCRHFYTLIYCSIIHVDPLQQK